MEVSTVLCKKRKIFYFILLFGVFYVFAEEEEEELVKEPIQNIEQTINIDRPKIEEGPTTEVITMPLSNEEKLMRARKKAEQTTEGKIKERLETLRLQDEQKRLNQLLPFEEQGSVSEKTLSPPPESPLPSSQYIPLHRHFVRLGLGNLKYFNTDTVISSVVSSIGIGVLEGSRVSFDVHFSYSTHRLPDESRQTQNLFIHYSWVMALKYFIFSGRLKPSIGVLCSYNWRRYRGDINFVLNEISSQSLNVGLVGGLEYFLGPRFIVGADVRFHVNMKDFEDKFYGKRRDYFEYYNEHSTPEELSWSTFNAFIGFLF